MKANRQGLIKRVFVALALAALAGCGLPANGKVAVVTPSDVPFGLLSTAAPGQTPQPTGPLVNVYLVRADHLDPLDRHVSNGNIPENSVRLLLLGPLPTEAARGLTSDIPAGTRLVSLDLNGAVAAVDLSSDFGAVGGSDQVLAVAQIVYTLTSSRYIDAVVFSINGKRIEIPDGSGSLSDRPMGRGDYSRLLASG